MKRNIAPLLVVMTLFFASCKQSPSPQKVLAAEAVIPKSQHAQPDSSKETITQQPTLTHTTWLPTSSADPHDSLVPVLGIQMNNGICNVLDASLSSDYMDTFCDTPNEPMMVFKTNKDTTFLVHLSDIPKSVGDFKIKKYILNLARSN